MNKLKLFLSAILALGVTTMTSFAQEHVFNWSQPVGSGANEVGFDVASDANGNIISTGYYRSTLDFEAGTGVTNLTAAGGADIFVKKVDTDGNLIWAVSVGGTSDDVALGVTTDAVGDVYVTGYFAGTIDLDPGTGTQSHTSTGANDIFIVKLDANGNYLWSHTFGSTADETGRKLEVDGNGNLWCTGYFRGTVDFDPSAGNANLTSNGAADMFLLKLDAAGNYIWAHNFGSASGNDDGYDLAIDASNNVYLTGYFNFTVDFDPGAGTQNLTAVGGADPVIVKLSNTGNYIWANSFPGGFDEIAYGMTLDNAGMPIITGRFTGTVDFDPGAGTADLTSAGAYDMFIAKYDQNGQYQWAHSFGSTSGDEGFGIASDASGNLYVTGFFRGTVDFDPGVTTTANLTSNGDADAFFLKLDAMGNYVSAFNFGGTTNDHGYEIEYDVNNSVSLTGYYTATVDFDPGVGSATSTSVGGSDIFFVNYKECFPDATTDVINACGPITWIDGNTYSTNNYTATHTYTNVGGCDSVVTLHLTMYGIADQTASATTTTSCDSLDVTVDLASSETGVTYWLRDDANDTIVDGPINGNGSALAFNGGKIYQSMDYNVYAEQEIDFGVMLDRTTFDRVEVNNPPIDYNNEITVEAWILFDNTTTDDELWLSQAMFNSDVMSTNVWLWSPNNGQIQWHVNDNGTWRTAETVGASTLDGWHHFATSADANGTYIYIDGVLNASSATGITTGIQSSPNSSMFIGADVRYPNSARHGTYGISELRIWDTYKSATDIAASMNNCLAGNEAGLVYWNKFNDNTGTTATASIGESGQFSTNMDATDWMVSNNVCETACTAEMSQVVSFTVNQSTSSMQTASNCEEYTWTQTGQTYTATGMYSDTITNTAGCDSVIWLDLTILDVTTSSITASACDSYTVPSGDETYTVTGNYTDTIPNMAGCDSIITIDLTIGTPDVSVTTSGITITSNATGVTYQWLDCNNNYAPIAGETSQSFTATADGDYAVEITDGSCVDTSACQTIAGVGFSEEENVINIYPNPTDGNIWINLTNFDQFAEVRVYSIDGKLQMSRTINTNNSMLSLAGMSSGLYTVEVIQNEQRFIRKIRLF